MGRVSSFEDEYERGYHEIFIKRSTGWGEKGGVFRRECCCNPVVRVSSTLSFEDVLDDGLSENYANHGEEAPASCGSREKLVS